ncbi:hypothetical protein [Bdellovibrio svalbardensis]|uniref:Uncharacterized protein n=1 Tax=Bdellovibrio svalbardensis TaxID=2972972 RepID=A0ABT6DMN2_9BACT|nr:hypothetical protein [Bdellovibrio svalbardensis]MDG0818130.1 hypothetical protein [Bdellovibrio svalbardensis]
MRFTIITLMLLISSISHGESHNFNGEIKEASISEKMLRKRLLRILQGTEVAIASNDSTEQLQAQSPSQA